MRRKEWKSWSVVADEKWVFDLPGNTARYCGNTQVHVAISALSVCGDTVLVIGESKDGASYRLDVSDLPIAKAVRCMASFPDVTLPVIVLGIAVLAHVLIGHC